MKKKLLFLLLGLTVGSTQAFAAKPPPQTDPVREPMEIFLTFVSTNAGTLASMAIGALITWWVARIYYKKASQDLLVESEELKRLNILMLRGLESAGLAEFSRNHEGKITGMDISAVAHLKAGSAKLGGKGTVTSNSDEDK